MICWFKSLLNQLEQLTENNISMIQVQIRAKKKTLWSKSMLPTLMLPVKFNDLLVQVLAKPVYGSSPLHLSYLLISVLAHFVGLRLG